MLESEILVSAFEHLDVHAFLAPSTGHPRFMIVRRLVHGLRGRSQMYTERIHMDNQKQC